MQRLRLATIAILLMPAAAMGEKLDYGVRSQLSWRDNVYGSSEESVDDPIEDWAVGVSPWGAVSDDEGDLTWSLRYQPTYEYYLQETGARNFDHDVTGELEWRIADRTTLHFSELYQDYESVVHFNEVARDPTDPAVLRTGQTPVVGSFTTLGLRHSLTPRDFLTLDMTYGYRDYDESFSSDRDSYVAATSYTRALSERTTVGAQASWTRQIFARPVGDDVITDYYNLSGILEHRFSRTLRVELSAGPTWVQAENEPASFLPRFGVAGLNIQGQTLLTDVDATECPRMNPALPLQENPELANYNPFTANIGYGNCGVTGRFLEPGELEALGYPRGDPQVPGREGARPPKITEFTNLYEESAQGLSPLDDAPDGEVTYFATAALYKDWERWHAELSYQRSADDSGSFGASSVQDTFLTRLSWQPAPLWNLALTAAYELTEQATDFAVPSGVIIRNEPVPAGVDTVSQIAAVQGVIARLDDDAVSYNTLSLSFSAHRRLTERASAFVAVYWYEQEQEFDTGQRSISFVPGESAGGSTTSRWNSLTLQVGLEWQFDTFKF